MLSGSRTVGAIVPWLSLVILVSLLSALGCTTRVPDPETSLPRVVATTTYLADLVEQLGGDDVQIHSLLSAGADPHLYQPTPSDAQAIAQAALVVTNGLGLEGWVDGLIDHAGGSAARVTASEQVPALAHPRYPDAMDPHFWFDARYWSTAAGTVSAALQAVADEPARARIATRTAAYQAELAALDAWAVAQLDTVPEDARQLVTSHDAFQYFGARYGWEVRGIQGITTEQQPSQRDIADTIDAVRSTGTPAVFVETSVNPAVMERVAREAGVQTAGPLYSDSTGPADGPAASYVGTFSENIRMIVTALGGRFTPFAFEPTP
jgi:ABC-type Zn uptake system ZnuABC Zn-binding protein ZnuA